MISDGVEMTEFIMEYLEKDKITILGHSRGTYLGSNLVLNYPEYYDCYIGTGQLVDFIKMRLHLGKRLSNGSVMMREVNS